MRSARFKIVLNQLLVTVLLIASGNSDALEQTLSLSASSLTGTTDGGPIEIIVYYSQLESSQKSTGIGFALHYDAAAFSVISPIDAGLVMGGLGVTQQAESLEQLQGDTINLDRVIRSAYASFQSPPDFPSFSSGEAAIIFPIELLRVFLKPKADYQGLSRLVLTGETGPGNELVLDDQGINIRKGPLFTSVPVSITLVAARGQDLTISNPAIQNFLSTAAAVNFASEPVITQHDAPSVFAAGSETRITFIATDDDGRISEVSALITVIEPSVENDSDGDQMNDRFEVDYGLDPNRPDAEEDLDGDGRNNLAEYVAGSNPRADDISPMITAPADRSLDAFGPLTQVDIGLATAQDALDGAVMAVPNTTGPFAPGRHEVLWRATDAAGNSAETIQTIQIRPQVSLSQPRRMAEGDITIVHVYLNGDAPSYPVEVPILLTGSAALGTDYDVSARTVVIESGRRGSIELSSYTDTTIEGEERVEIVLDIPSRNAILSNNITTQILIVEEPVAPALTLTIQQNEAAGRRVWSGGGKVTITLKIEDPNGVHTVDWSQTNNNLVRIDAESQLAFTFDPNNLPEGGFEVIALVSDSEINSERFEVRRLIWISQNPVMTDIDADGVPDEVSGEVRPNMIALSAETDGRAVYTEAGYLITIGDVAMANGLDGILIDEDMVAQFGENGLNAPLDGDDEAFNYPLGVFDFDLSGILIPGGTVSLIIPLGIGVPDSAQYRKYMQGTGWSAFTADSLNRIASARGEGGTCPMVGSDFYQPGLQAGHRCLELKIEDGGPNDADGQANGVIADPSGVAEPVPTESTPTSSGTTPPVASASGGGGGCSMRSGSNDWGLVVLLLFLCVQISLRHRVGLSRRKAEKRQNA